MKVSQTKQKVSQTKQKKYIIGALKKIVVIASIVKDKNTEKEGLKLMAKIRKTSNQDILDKATILATDRMKKYKKILKYKE